MSSASAPRWSGRHSRLISCTPSWLRHSSPRAVIWHGWRRSRSSRSSSTGKTTSRLEMIMSRSRLHELSEHGVSVWMDSLSREMLETGELARLMDEDAVVGVTSNPTIFQKALSEGNWYDDQLRAVAAEVDEPREQFIALAQ